MWVHIFSEWLWRRDSQSRARTGCREPGVRIRTSGNARDPHRIPPTGNHGTSHHGLGRSRNNCSQVRRVGSEPVSDPCVEVNGIDWILRPQETESDPAKAASATASSHNTAPANSASPAASQKAGTSTPAPVRTSNVQRSGGVWTATTYGRTPAIEVTFDADKVPSSTLLTSLSSAVKQVPAQKKCTNLNEVPGGH